PPPSGRRARGGGARRDPPGARDRRRGPRGPGRAAAGGHRGTGRGGVSGAIAVEVRRGRWADSARLLAAARAAEAEPGVARAACFMATPANLAGARDLGLWDEALASAGPDDLVIAVAGDDPAAGAAAAARALDAGHAWGAGEAGARRAPRSLVHVAADLAIVSVPGEYA